MNKELEMWIEKDRGTLASLKNIQSMELCNKCAEEYLDKVIEDLENDLKKYKKQPTINTFEKLAEKLPLKIDGDFIKKSFDKNNRSFCSFYKNGDFCCVIPFTRINPQQAYNIIKCLQDNLGGN